MSIGSKKVKRPECFQINGENEQKKPKSLKMRAGGSRRREMKTESSRIGRESWKKGAGKKGERQKVLRIRKGKKRGDDTGRKIGEGGKKRIGSEGKWERKGRKHENAHRCEREG